jgi:hypothetical protein
MTIESIAGARKYRVSPVDNRVVQLQPYHGARWVDYRTANTLEQASALVLALARVSQDETQELEAVRSQ